MKDKIFLLLKDIKFILFIAGGLFVFLLDTITVKGYAEWLVYIILIFFYLNFTDDKKKLPYIAGFYSLLIIAGFFISATPYFTIFIPIINRLLGITVMVMFTLVGMREKEAKSISSEILERVKDLFIALDRKFNVVFFNKRVTELTNVEQVETGKNIFEVFPVLMDNQLKSKLYDAVSTDQPVHFEYSIPGTENFLDVSIYTSKKGISVFAKDITQRVIAERRLLDLLHEKEMLMKEMHHRTKNNFQLVMSLLNLQINSIKDEISIKILNETRARLNSISILYDKLFKAGSVYTVDMRSFISDIINGMDTAVNFGMLRMNNEINIEDARIGIEAAIPIGLIINELYTNSLKYAFDGTGNGSVAIEMRFIDQSSLYLKYKDNGKGLPPDFDIDNSGLGSTLITGFVSQLKGEISCRNNNGAEFEMKLQVIKNQTTVEIPRPVIQ